MFGGYAARAGDIRFELKYVCDTWSVQVPGRYLEVMMQHKPKGLVLVDHNDMSLMLKGIDFTFLRGIIDHHAYGAMPITSSSPIHVDIRPWGACSTIVAHMFITHCRKMKQSTAGLLLCGILSDTLNLLSPATTNMDRLMVALLAKQSNISDVNELAKQMFKARTRDHDSMSPHMLVRGDMKLFRYQSPRTTLSVALGVVESTSMKTLAESKDDMLIELRALKKEDEVDLAFLALIDPIASLTLLLVCGPAEQSLAETAFGVSTMDHMIALDGKVSRKKDILPPLAAALAAGWTSPHVEVLEEDFGPVVSEPTDKGYRISRRKLHSRTVAQAEFMLKSLQLESARRMQQEDADEDGEEKDAQRSQRSKHTHRRHHSRDGAESARRRSRDRHGEDTERRRDKHGGETGRRKHRDRDRDSDREKDGDKRTARSSRKEKTLTMSDPRYRTMPSSKVAEELAERVKEQVTEWATPRR